MSCTQKQQLVCFPKVRVYKPWFRHFNDHKDFRNEGTVHLFSLMALFSYANFRSNERVINGDRYMEEPGQWICKLGALPRILRVHSKAQALELMEHFQDHGFLTFEILDEEKEILRFTIADWKEHCTHLQYNYYSYKGSGFFFFPLPVGRLLLKTARKEVGIVFSELDAIMDMWLHTILNDPKVRGSEYMPVVYYSNKPATLGVTIKKSGNYEVQPGQTMRYDFSGIANTSNVALNHFFWHDRIPTDATRALSISTGTYNARLYYKVTFKTNLNDYRTLASNLLTSNNYSLSLNAATLRLAQGEYVTDVRFEFGTVPSGFSSAVKPTMRVQVLGSVSNGYQIINRADVGGQYINEWQTAKTTWVTTVRRFNTVALPKTGY